MFNLQRNDIEHDLHLFSRRLCLYYLSKVHEIIVTIYAFLHFRIDPFGPPFLVCSPGLDELAGKRFFRRKRKLGIWLTIHGCQNFRTRKPGSTFKFFIPELDFCRDGFRDESEHQRIRERLSNCCKCFMLLACFRSWLCLPMVDYCGMPRDLQQHPSLQMLRVVQPLQWTLRLRQNLRDRTWMRSYSAAQDNCGILLCTCNTTMHTTWPS